MKLLGSLTSPFVRKVRIALAEKKVVYEFVLDSPWVEGNTVAVHNPLGKVPVLILDDETRIYDSRVIVEYLDGILPNLRLIPESGRERMLVKRWEALADGICDAAATVFLERKRELAQQSPEWISRQMSKLDQGLAAMSAELGSHNWCYDDMFGLADISAGCALGYLEFRFAELKWASRHPNLARLYQQLMLRPAFVDTVPKA